MVTISDIAKRLGVAVSTVSKGLNGANDISESTRSLILNTAVEMGYASRKVQKSGLRRMCVFAEEEDFHSEDPFGYDLAMGFQAAAIQNGWQVSVVSYRGFLDSQEPLDVYMLRYGFTGAFLIQRRFGASYLKKLIKINFPLVLFEGEVDNPCVGSVGNDHRRGVFMAVDYLYRLGHRKIALVNSAQDRGFAIQQGYSDALNAHQLEFQQPLLVYHDGEKTIRPAVEQFLKQGATAVLCAGNYISNAVISHLLASGCRVPQEISVLGLDDGPRTGTKNYPYTAVYQDNLSLGKAAFYMLEGLRNQIPMQNLLLRPKLIIGETTAPCRESL